MIGSGLGVYLALTIVTSIIAAGIGIGTAAAGDDIATSVTGTLAIGCRFSGACAPGGVLGSASR